MPISRWLRAVTCVFSTVALAGCAGTDDTMNDNPSPLAGGSVTFPSGACVVNFEATVRSGPSAGTALVGFAMFQTDASGALTNAYFHTVDGQRVPITGRAQGNTVELNFDLGSGRTIHGTGTLHHPLGACSGAMEGPFTGPSEGDRGDWLANDGDVILASDTLDPIAQPEDPNAPDLALIRPPGSITPPPVLPPPPPPPPAPPPGGGTTPPPSSGQTLETPGSVFFLTAPSQHVVYRFTGITGAATVFAGALNSPGLVNGSRQQARFNQPTGLGYDAARRFLYVSDPGNNAVRRIDLNTNQVTTRVMQPTISGASIAAGFASLPTFRSAGVACDLNGNLFMTDRGNHAIWRMQRTTGAVTLFAGAPPMIGSSDGVGSAARFNAPALMVISADARLLTVSEPTTCRVRLVEVPNGAVSTIAAAGGC